MNEMIERVCRAMCVESGIDPDAPCTLSPSRGMIENGETNWSACIFMARAVIKVMREPTVKMIEAVPYDMYDPDFAENWRSMIDAALKERP